MCEICEAIQKRDMEENCKLMNELLNEKPLEKPIEVISSTEAQDRMNEALNRIGINVEYKSEKENTVIVEMNIQAEIFRKKHRDSPDRFILSHDAFVQLVKEIKEHRRVEMDTRKMGNLNVCGYNISVCFELQGFKVFPTLDDHFFR